MKIIFNSKNVFIDQDNISAYHCKLLCMKKLKIHQRNFSSVYLASNEGFPLNNSSIMEKEKIYHLKNRLPGSSGLYKMGNSLAITIIGGILFGVMTSFYYSKYLSKIILVIPQPLQDQLLNNFFSKQSLQPSNKTEMSGGGIKNTLSAFKSKITSSSSDVKGKLSQSISSTKQKLENFGDFLKYYLFKFFGLIKDDQFDFCLCDWRQTCPTVVMKKEQKSVSAILSFTLFATYIFMLLLPLITNAATTISCKKPGFSKLIIPFIFIFIPILIMFIIPHITGGIDLLISKIKKRTMYITRDYNLAVSNVILLILMFVYLAINKKAISGIMWGMLPVALILFAIVKILPIEGILSKISVFISNKITNSEPVPEEPGSCNIKLTGNPPTRPNGNQPQAQECFIRYGFILDLLKSTLMTFLGFGLITGVYAAQVRKSCKL